MCGSSLIHESFVLTAAHCTRDAVAAFVYLNSSISLDPWIPGPALYSTDIRTNPAYSSLTIYNDLGIIRLPTPKPSIPTMTVANSSDAWLNLQTCSLVDVLGRGYTCGGGCLSNLLKKTQLPKIPYEDCISESYTTRWSPAVIGNDLCLGHENSCVNTTRIEETCEGDSGGPGFVGNTLIGVVSRGPDVPCGMGRRASIFANVADTANKQFITSTLRIDIPNMTIGLGPPMAANLDEGVAPSTVVLAVVLPVLLVVACMVGFHMRLSPAQTRSFITSHIGDGT
jgi:trypsin